MGIVRLVLVRVPAKKASEDDQEIPQSHIADEHTVLSEMATEH